MRKSWLNLDNEEDALNFASQSTLLSHIELMTGKEKAFVFIDEIQRKENAGLFLKGIFDMNLPYKFIISGSGSLELKANIAESMVGRKQLFMVEPVSFEEFVNFKTGYQYENRLKDFFALEKSKIERLLSEYMVFGGYPRVILAETTLAKQREMQEIYRSYIDRDIHNLLRLEKSDAFTSLLKILASQIGGLINITELSSTVGIDKKTIKNYLWYLEQTFIVKKVTPFYRNIRKEISKSPLYYFYDVGLRNWLLGLFGLPEIPSPLAGHLFENVVFNMLKLQLEATPTQIHFWRTRDHAEVDFVLINGLSMTPIEAQYTKMKKPDLTRSYHNFLSKYKPKNGYIIHLEGEKEILINNTKVYFIPYYDISNKSNL